MVEMKATDGGMPWRSITISAKDARGPIGEKLLDKHQRQFVGSPNRTNKIWWRKDEGGGYTYIFSPQAAHDAIYGRLKGMSLMTIEKPDATLLNDKFNLTASAKDNR
jgi:hypothetical protein